MRSLAASITVQAVLLAVVKIAQSKNPSILSKRPSKLHLVSAPSYRAILVQGAAVESQCFSDETSDVTNYTHQWYHSL
jgi:hypothetical protein